MKILLITKERLTYNEAAPSRILNLKKVLSEFHDIYIVAQRGGDVKEQGTFLVPKITDNIVLNQAFKMLLLLYSASISIFKKIDVYIARQYYLVPFIYPISRLFGFKIYYDMHCFRYKELLVENKKIKSTLNKPIEILCHRLADKLLIISEGIYSDLSEKLKSKAIMLPNGVNLEDFNNPFSTEEVLKKYKVPKDKPIILFLGNWMEWVDVETFLESSRYVKNSTFLVIGKGYEKSSFKEMKEKYPNAIFTGKINHFEALNLLQHSDICILPYKKADVVKHLSIRKTFEYLAAGKPIIMSDSNIHEKKFLEEGINILLYEAVNPVDLSNKIKTLLSNPSMMKKMSVNNKIISKKFSWKEVILIAI